MTSLHRSRLHEYQDLMRFRIMEVVLVSTPYEKFVLEEAGELSERMYGEFRNLDLHYSPALIGASTGAEALALVSRDPKSRLIVTSPHLRDMDAIELAGRVREAGLDVPVVLLARDAHELASLLPRLPGSGVDHVFLWQGDAQVMVGIVKTIEDQRNVANDSNVCHVQVILVVEDTIRHYSAFLPRMYQALLRQSRIASLEGRNLAQRILRMRARPKILLCMNYEEAKKAFATYGPEVLGIVCDVEFPRGGVNDQAAGPAFVRHVRARFADIPIVLHSTKLEMAQLADRMGVHFLHKGSGTMLEQLEEYMERDFGFGEFVFRMADGSEVGRAKDLRQLESMLDTVPGESLRFHAAANQFSRWLNARTEFELAREFRATALEDFSSTDELRSFLKTRITEYRREQGQYVVADFDGQTFDFSDDFYRIGSGSLGGKARGIAFVRRLLLEQGLRRQFSGVEIAVPPTVVIATGVFDEFLELTGLKPFALECNDDAEIRRRFDEAPLPAWLETELHAFVVRANWPLAVRSSSLLEDSQQQPFTGVYDTLMLRNDHADPAVRFEHLARAIKQIWASTFSRSAKNYIQATPYRLEEEGMAVMLQRIVGTRHRDRFYPDFAGVVRSHNFYPVAPMQATDGVAAVALGMGRAVCSEGTSLRFCPRYPESNLEMSTVKDMLRNTQRHFWALPMKEGPAESMRELRFDIGDAEADGTLHAVASTYSAENDAVYDGTSRSGVRLVTFAPILKHDVFPLAGILSRLMVAGVEGLGTDVEIEFAVTLSSSRGEPHRFAMLQIRPLGLQAERETLEIAGPARDAAIVHSTRVLGNGRIDGLRDLVVVDFQRFERAHSREAAEEIGRLNAELVAAGKPYILIGVGRWGSRDPWLGIPVSWDQVSGARVIVEAGLRDLKVTPSQGSHFFQNLTAFNIGYFTANPDLGEGRVDWNWLDSLPAVSARDHVRHIVLDAAATVLMNGRTGEGVILPPHAAPPGGGTADG